MKFQKNVSREKREFLSEQLKEYESHVTLTKEERSALHEWVSSGRSPYENGDYLCDGGGYPLDFVAAIRFNQELQDWFDNLSDEEKEAERTGSHIQYNTQTDESYFDVSSIRLSYSDDEELPF